MSICIRVHLHGRVCFYAEEEEEEEEGDASGVGEAHSPMTWQAPSPLSTSRTYKAYLPSLEVEEGAEVFPRLRTTKVQEGSRLKTRVRGDHTRHTHD